MLNKLKVNFEFEISDGSATLRKGLTVAEINIFTLTSYFEASLLIERVSHPVVDNAIHKIVANMFREKLEVCAVS